jgi:hypothetical protein
MLGPWILLRDGGGYNSLNKMNAAYARRVHPELEEYLATTRVSGLNGKLCSVSGGRCFGRDHGTRVRTYGPLLPLNRAGPGFEPRR